MELDCLMHAGAKDAQAAIYLVHVGFNEFAGCIFSIINIVHIDNIFSFSFEVLGIEIIFTFFALQEGQAELVEEAIP